jgi:protein O-mannosyl-transferase
MTRVAREIAVATSRRTASARPATPPVPRPVVRRRAALILLAGALVYVNSLTGPFIFDDRGTILDNTTIERLDTGAVLAPPHETPVAGRPVVNLTFALNYALGERRVAGYHVTNVVIHLLCALLVFGIVRRSSQSLDLGTAVALIWAVHPLNTEAVTYVTQRTESLMAFCYLFTLYASIRALRRGPRWELLAVVACGLGMASKESMVTAPLMVVAYDRIFVFDSLRHAFRKRWPLYLWLAGTWLVLAGVMLTGPRNLSAGFTAPDAAPWTYLLNQAVMIVRYLRLAVWPGPLAIYYGWPLPLGFADVWLHAIVVLSLCAATLLALRRWPRIGFLGLWFFVTLAPTSSIVPIPTEVGAERRMYLPLVAVVVLAVLGTLWLWQFLVRRLGTARLPLAHNPQRIATYALIVVCLALGARTLLRNREYQSSLRLAETTLQRWPTPAAHGTFGTELAAAGRLGEAESHLRIAAPDYPPAKYYLGTVLARVDKRPEAIAQFQAYIREEHPSLTLVHTARGMLADLYMKDGEWAAATEQYRAILAARPEDNDARRLLATALVQQRSYYEAIAHFRSVLADRPDDVQALGGLGIALASIGRMDEAITAFRRAVDIDPHNEHARQNLARAIKMTPRNP